MFMEGGVSFGYIGATQSLTHWYYIPFMFFPLWFAEGYDRPKPLSKAFVNILREPLPPAADGSIGFTIKRSEA